MSCSLQYSFSRCRAIFDGICEPCSQRLIVARLTPKSFAKASCDSCESMRIFLISSGNDIYFTSFTIITHATFFFKEKYCLEYRIIEAFGLFQLRRHNALPGRMAAVLKWVTGHKNERFPLRCGERPV